MEAKAHSVCAGEAEGEAVGYKGPLSFLDHLDRSWKARAWLIEYLCLLPGRIQAVDHVVPGWQSGKGRHL